MEDTNTLNWSTHTGQPVNNNVLKDPSNTDNEGPARLGVKPRLGLFDAIVFIMGYIIGSGIFISPKGALQYTGSVGMSLVIWTVCGGVSATFALIYAELGVMLPRSGGDYSYIKVGIGSGAAFLVSWIQTIIINSGGRAVIALVFADYLCAPIFGKCGPPNSVRKSLATAKIISLALANTASVNLVKSSQWVFTTLKVLALLAIAFGGVVYLCQGNVANFDNAFVGTTNDISSIAIAIYNCMWAYSGFQHLNEIAEEIKNPKQTIPRAITVGIILVTLVYLLANISYLTVLPKAEFLSTSAVAFAWAEKVFGAAAILIPVGVVCSVYGAGVSGVLAESRMRFVSSRSGHLPEVLSFLHHKTRIPVAAIWFNTMCALVMLIPADISELINLVSFAAYTIVGLSMIASLRLRHLTRKQRRDKDFRLPVIFPAFGLLICIFMVVAPLIHNPKPEMLYGVLIIAAGVLFYFPFVHFKLTVPGIDHITTGSQLLLDICPTVEEDNISQIDK